MCDDKQRAYNEGYNDAKADMAVLIDREPRYDVYEGRHFKDRISEKLGLGSPVTKEREA